MIIDLKTGLETQLNKDQTLSCAVGNFDGVHIGHHKLITEAKNLMGADNSAAWTFKLHPRICMGDSNAKRLSSVDQKLEQFALAGLDYAILEDFTQVRDMSPKDFVSDLLFSKCNVRHGVCGYNFRFGKNAEGTELDFKKYFEELGACATIVDPVILDGNVAVSSSLIRKLIEEGNIKKANRYLGHPFSIKLPVTEGRKLGRKIGIPTINQVFPEYYAIPKHGVYVCSCMVEGKNHIGVSNVGIRPTIDPTTTVVNCETHIIDYSGWLYGKVVDVQFHDFLRPETRFSSIDELVSQIHKDIETAKKYSEIERTSP
jgi:riboflavin kinase/FMN adenylyltransferase